MNEILSVGLILLSALVAGHVAQAVRVPEVMGYLLVGVVIGPAGLDLISAENRDALQFLSEVALGLILFSIGLIFEAELLRKVGGRIAMVTLAEAGAAFALVFLGLVALGLPVPAALLLGVIAMETAPATTLMVVREYDARGPLTDVVMALLGFNNMFVLIAFGIVAAMLQFFLPAAGSSLASLAYAAGFNLVWGAFGSIALGILLGLGLQAWADRVHESGELSILAVGVVLVAVGGARYLDLSPLFVTLALGATLVNATHRSGDLAKALGRADPPLYAAFFVLAGAELQPSKLGGIGMVGAAYVLLRVGGKLAGAWAAARRLQLAPVVRRYLGLCLVSSSSLAIGLTIQVRTQFPDYAPVVTAIALAAVIAFEVAGPLTARKALLLSGEANPQPRGMMHMASAVPGQGPGIGGQGSDPHGRHT